MRINDLRLRFHLLIQKIYQLYENNSLADFKNVKKIVMISEHPFFKINVVSETEFYEPRNSNNCDVFYKVTQRAYKLSDAVFQLWCKLNTFDWKQLFSIYLREKIITIIEQIG